jgi:ABC-type branched-subunit amino acid transport system ATPase component
MNASGMTTSGLTVRFGGVTALAGVTVSLPVGRISGVIGPNGAGKTTLFNTLAGAVAPTSGRVRYGDRDVTRWSTVRRSRAGIARTFQGGASLGTLTVGENLTVAVVSDGAGGRLWKRRDDADIRDRTLELAERFALTPYLEREAASVPQVARLGLGMAMAMAARPTVLLLDEPFGGATRQETDLLVDVIAAAASPDRAIVVIEHDVGAVMRLCAHLTVLNSGQVVAEGAPEVIEKSDAVIEAYLGERYSRHGLSEV